MGIWYESKQRKLYCFIPCNYNLTRARRWQVQAWWEGDEEYKNATSPSVFFTVKKIPPTISIQASESQITAGDSITITGTIEPEVPDIGIVIHFTKPDGSTFERTATTGGDGSYSYTSELIESGLWYVRSSWECDLLYGEANSQAVSIKVIEPSCNLKIVVKDVEGNRIEGASISSTSMPSGQSPLSGSTNADGSVSFSGKKMGSYTFEASKSGYVTKSGSVNAEAGEMNELTITIEKEPSESKGIPGFPYESICLGLLVGIIVLLIVSRTQGS